MKVSDLSDSHEVYQLQKELNEADEQLARLKLPMGKAWHILEYDSDERKRALAKAMTPFLDEGESAAAADAKARASFNYGEDIKRLKVAHESATITKANWEYWNIRFKSRQSLISLEKTLANI